MRCSLGIDLGTTTIKACLISDGKRIIHEAEAKHDATLDSQKEPTFHEQNAKRIVESLLELLRKEFSTVIEDVSVIGVSGQMHGIVLWNCASVQNAKSSADWICSNLITWMDKRCSDQFLNSLPPWLNENGEMEGRIATGYGMCTLAWLSMHKQLDERWDRCGTIMEFFTAIVTGVDRVAISTQNAYGWGYCGLNKTWQIENLRETIPWRLLPVIVEPGHIIGSSRKLSNSIIKADVKVIVALGDFQASLLPVLRCNEAAVHLGTSAQLAFITNREIQTRMREKFPAITILPFFRTDEKLITVASLNGGNTFEAFAKQIALWSHSLYGTPRNPALKTNVIEEALNQSNTIKERPALRISPLFHGERHNPNASASVQNWNANATLDQILQEIARGTIRNLSEMMSAEFLAEFGILTIRLINRAAQAAYQAEAVEAFAPLNIICGEKTDTLSAAYGAALYALKYL